MLFILVKTYFIFLFAIKHKIPIKWFGFVYEIYFLCKIYFVDKIDFNLSIKY